MILKEIQQKFHKELDAIYGIEEVDSFFYILLGHYSGYSRVKLALEPKLAVSNGEAHVFLKALSDLKSQKPIQYIIGETEFFGLKFKVNNHVLIPRPETDELVDWILNELENRDQKINILDIGTGSGCIAISLAKHLPNANVYALDVSLEALSIAKENAETNKVDVQFIEADILNMDNLTFETFDIIISNPPYVRMQEKLTMKANVLQNEPHLALFVTNEDPLQFYKAITEFAVNNLSKNGMLYFEINEYLGDEMISMLKDYNYNNIQLNQDMFSKNRMIKANK